MVTGGIPMTIAEVQLLSPYTAPYMFLSSLVELQIYVLFRQVPASYLE